MSFTTVMYFAFLLVGIIVYYILPKKIQWAWLLVMSYAYYFTFSIKTSVFMIFTTTVIYIGGRWLDKINRESKSYIAEHKAELSRDEKKAYKEKTKHQKRRVLALLLILAFGLLAVVKYADFMIANIDALVLAIGHGQYLNPINLVLPIGISFYTFQSASYVIDVYQGKYESEKNPFKLALFVSFFPQILQGPIGRFDRLGHQFFEGHKFNLTQIQFGLQRIGWGLFKKVVLADRTAPVVLEIFTNYESYGGFYNILAVLLYTVQLYMDFSGGIDIVIGSAQMFGIELDENFRQPFFSKSIGEFWRRWHITLGTWMKDYIFYPLSLSKAMNHFGKWSKKHFGNTFGRTIPICFANLLIFFVVGIWHGAAWKYIAYGMYNGVIIAFSNLMEPVYHKGIEFFHINSESRGWKVFQIIRTFILVNVGWFFDMGEGLRPALSMIKRVFWNMNITQLTDGSMLKLGMNSRDYIIVVIGCLIVFVVSVLKEKGIKIRETIAARPLPVRWVLYYGMILLILLLGFTGETQGFIYANFQMIHLKRQVRSVGMHLNFKIICTKY